MKYLLLILFSLNAEASYLKNKPTSSGAIAKYHTLFCTGGNFQKLPDQNGNGGSTSYFVIASFLDKQNYQEGKSPLETKQYTLSFMKSIQFGRGLNDEMNGPSGKSVEKAIYDYLKVIDPFYSDAVWVE